jgi:hypothetical protein
MSYPPPHNRIMKVKKSFTKAAQDQLLKRAVYTLCTHCYTLIHDKFFPPGKTGARETSFQGPRIRKRVLGPCHSPKLFTQVHIGSHWFTIKNLFKKFPPPKCWLPPCCLTSV